MSGHAPKFGALARGGGKAGSGDSAASSQPEESGNGPVYSGRWGGYGGGCEDGSTRSSQEGSNRQSPPGRREPREPREQSTQTGVRFSQDKYGPPFARSNEYAGARDLPNFGEWNADEGDTNYSNEYAGARDLPNFGEWNADEGDTNYTNERTPKGSPRRGYGGGRRGGYGDGRGGGYGGGRGGGYGGGREGGYGGGRGGGYGGGRGGGYGGGRGGGYGGDRGGGYGGDREGGYGGGREGGYGDGHEGGYGDGREGGYGGGRGGPYCMEYAGASHLPKLEDWNAGEGDTNYTDERTPKGSGDSQSNSARIPNKQSSCWSCF